MHKQRDETNSPFSLLFLSSFVISPSDPWVHSWGLWTEQAPRINASYLYSLRHHRSMSCIDMMHKSSQRCAMLGRTSPTSAVSASCRRVLADSASGGMAAVEQGPRTQDVSHQAPDHAFNRVELWFFGALRLSMNNYVSPLARGGCLGADSIRICFALCTWYSARLPLMAAYLLVIHLRNC